MGKSLIIIKSGSKELSENSIIKKCQQGDRKAFNNLVKKYQDMVFNLSLRLLGNKEEALDVSQEIFLKIYNSILDFKYNSAFSTWVYRITINTCKNKSLANFKRNSLVTNINESSDDTESLNILELVSDKSLSPMEEIEINRQNEIIQSAINSLPFLYKNVVILADIQGYSYKEISEICNITIQNVKNRLIRGRRLIREKLDGVLI